MLTEQTKKLIVDFFAALAEGESKVESCRLSLNSCEDFDPFLLFNRLDQYRKNYLTEDNLLDFASLHKIDATINQGKFLILFYDTDSTRSLNYNEFLNLVLCKDFYQMRQNASSSNNYQNEPNSSYISYETENKFCQLLQNEFILIQTIDKILADIKSYGDFSVSELLTLLGVNGNNITASIFASYLEQNGVNLSQEDVNGLIKRLDLKRNGRIDMSNLEKVFYFPYSSPPSKVVSRSPSVQNNLGSSRKNSQFSSSYMKQNEEKDIISSTNNVNIESSNVNLNNNEYQPKNNFGYKGKRNLYSINTDTNLESTGDNTLYRQSNVKFGRTYGNNINTNYNISSNSYSKPNYDMNTNYNQSRNCYQYQSTIQQPQTQQYQYQYQTRPNLRFQSQYTEEPLTQTYGNNNNYNITSKYNYTSKICNTNQNEIASPMRISKTLALRLSPTRKLSPQRQGFMPSQYSNYEGNKDMPRSMPEPIFTEQNFISFITTLMTTEKELEAKKIQTLCSLPDFNIEDVFLIFETPNTKNNILSFDDLKQGLQGKLNIQIDDKSLELLLQRYDLIKEGGISYSNLFDMLGPFDKENRDNVEQRPSVGEMSQNTINVLKNFFGLLLDSEQKIEMLRQKISSLKGFDIRKIYNEQIDQYGYGFNSDDDLESYLKRKGINFEQRDADLLFIRLDRNRDGKISCDDFLLEFNPLN